MSHDHSSHDIEDQDRRSRSGSWVRLMRSVRRWSTPVFSSSVIYSLLRQNSDAGILLPVGLCRIFWPILCQMSIKRSILLPLGMQVMPSACSYACLSACIWQKTHVQTTHGGKVCCFWLPCFVFVQPTSSYVILKYCQFRPTDPVSRMQTVQVLFKDGVSTASKFLVDCWICNDIHCEEVINLIRNYFRYILFVYCGKMVNSWFFFCGLWYISYQLLIPNVRSVNSHLFSVGVSQWISASFAKIIVYCGDKTQYLDPLTFL